MIWHPAPLATRAAVFAVLIILAIVVGVLLSGYGDCC
jgi:hypothetical protein